MRLSPQHWLALAVVVTVGCSTPDATRPSDPNTGREIDVRPTINTDAVDDDLDEEATATATRVDGDRTRAVVYHWNDLATVAVARMGSGPTGLPPYLEANIYAIANTAMHDALNSIVPRYKRYAFDGALTPDASSAAAVAQAAHDALAASLPPQAAFLDEQLAATLAAIPASAGKTGGIALGSAAAAAVLATRVNDGSAQASIPYTFGTGPGDYRATPPFDGPPFNGFADVPAWGKVRPFVLHSGSQFRAPPPYGAASNAAAVQTRRYTRDYEEILRLGGVVSARTADQTEIGLFFLENSPVFWNRIARHLGDQHRLGAWRSARMFALLGLAEGDAYIATFDSKYHYNFWRPFTATKLADADGNASTIPDLAWDVLAPPTPPIPDYPSGHGTAGGAAAAVLSFVFRGDTGPFETTSASLPGVSRRFNSVWDAAWQNADSRVYVGYHFRAAAEMGTAQGALVGYWAAMHALRRRR
ncbi:MAG: vanadium-dependent haloperoxidase [Gemmatimonadota bacterium]